MRATLPAPIDSGTSEGDTTASPPSRVCLLLMKRFERKERGEKEEKEVTAGGESLSLLMAASALRKKDRTPEMEGEDVEGDPLPSYNGEAEGGGGMEEAFEAIEKVPVPVGDTETVEFEDRVEEEEEDNSCEWFLRRGNPSLTLGAA